MILKYLANRVDLGLGKLFFFFFFFFFFVFFNFFFFFFFFFFLILLSSLMMSISRSVDSFTFSFFILEPFVLMPRMPHHWSLFTCVFNCISLLFFIIYYIFPPPVNFAAP